MKKTVTIQGKRDWTGPLENYEKWKKEIEHWCDGGEVEAKGCNAQWAGGHYCFDSEELEYRIKQRDPNYGEVWLIGSAKTPCVFRDTDNNYKFVRLDGYTSYTTELSLEYAAPSVEAYYAMKWNADTDDMDIHDKLDHLLGLAKEE